MIDDVGAMRRAIKLSRRGFPAPNPHVGCVLVRDGEIIGEGFHKFAGAPHAEAMALASAKLSVAGATAFVTLEPCNHFGRTPPCSQALIEAGVARVVIACPDPNPRASGGANALREAGIDVEVGLLRDEAEAANHRFLFAFRHGRPWVVVKAGASLDGRIALPSGESKWITSEASRAQGHRLRAEMGAVVVGRQTVEADDPLLTARIPGVVNQPLRIVLDPSGRLDTQCRVFNDAAETIWVVRAATRPNQFELPDMSLPKLMAHLRQRGVISLLVEGGGTTIGHFFANGLVDEVALFLGPRVLGEGSSWVNACIGANLKEVPELEIDSCRKSGDDVWIRARVRRN
ncbi:MAG: bifunctional diaminohydroxyphosphoribosylaminopyrimidine deaminase/5-amino-6-(5-phosphoribosylamino)uracil reductase RibD [Fimbriimonas sp.]